MFCKSPLRGSFRRVVMLSEFEMMQCGVEHPLYTAGSREIKIIPNHGSMGTRLACARASTTGACAVHCFLQREVFLRCEKTDSRPEKSLTPRPHRVYQRIKHSFHHIPHHTPAHVWVGTHL